jgi:adenosylmethionine-8-amino-7-oxononanoate aminotransferase
VTGLAPDGIANAFFVSGGSEGSESALKLARQYWVETGKPSKHKVISRWGSYHGNTIGALSMSGRKSWAALYAPYLLDFRHIEPSNEYRCGYCRGSCTLQCAEDLERAIVEEGPETVSAFIADPIVGSTLAAAAPPPGYFPAVREICDRYDVLFIADEVITGFGRTGRNFGIDHWGVTPDMIVCGKGISSGYVPLGAVLTQERFGRAYRDGSGAITHGFTYGGNPLSCAIGLAVQDYVRDHDLIARSAELGDYFYERAQRLRELPFVGDVRGGKGLFLGVEIVQDKDERRPFPRSVRFGETLQEAALEVGMTMYVGTGGAHGDGGDAFMLAPPFVISREQIDDVIDLAAEAIELTTQRCQVAS